MLASKAHQETKSFRTGDEPIMIQFVRQLTRSKAFRTVIIVVIVLSGVLAGLETNASFAADHTAKHRAELKTASHALRKELEARHTPPVAEANSSCPSNPSSPSAPSPTLSSCRAC